MMTDSPATSTSVEPLAIRRARRVLAIKVAMIFVVLALAGLFVAQSVFHLGDQSSPCASHVTHATAGIPRCRP